MQNKNGKSSSWWQTLSCFQPGRGIHIRHHIIAGCAPCRPIFWQWLKPEPALHFSVHWNRKLTLQHLCTCELQSLGLDFPSGAQQIDFLFLLVLVEGLWHSLHLHMSSIPEASWWVHCCFVPPVYIGLSVWFSHEDQGEPVGFGTRGLFGPKLLELKK